MEKKLLTKYYSKVRTRVVINTVTCIFFVSSTTWIFPLFSCVLSALFRWFNWRIHSTEWMLQRQQAVAADRQAERNLVEGLSQMEGGGWKEDVRSCLWNSPIHSPLVSDLFRRHVPSGIYGWTSRAKYAFEVCGGNIHWAAASYFRITSPHWALPPDTSSSTLWYSVGDVAGSLIVPGNHSACFKLW